MSTPHTKLAAGPRSDEAEGAATRASLDFVPLLCSAVALLCILFVSIALGTHEWIQGAVVHGGVPAEAYVGLSSVDVNGTSSHLAALCPKGTSHQVPASFTDTPPAVWCKCERAGTAGEWLIFLAYVPLWAACLFSAVEGLAATHPRAKAVKAKLSGMGVGQQLQQRALIGFWAAAWLCLFLGLLAYASLAPDTLGWGTVVFEASFNLARLAFLLVTIATALISAKLLGLWHEEAFGEALGDFLEARGARRALYFVLCGQLLLFLFASIENLEWQALIPLFALYYLDSGKSNFLLLYVTLTLMTLLFDLIRLCALPRYAYMDGKDAFAESLYCLVFLTKFGALGLLAVLKRQEMAASQYPDTGDGREPEIAE